MEPGTQLGHYEILEAIGKGGMGEVWRAKDSKLDREVAIKTLPPEFAEDPDRLARFEREAKLLASLNHPNIAAIYGLEEHKGSRFLVLELVEGDTLGDRIKQGPIPVEDALKLALQIADALKAAHESGVIHRDLKPDNIKVSDDGNVKVLDFGLAKALSTEEAEVNVSNSPTLSMAATQAGVILGTAAYMSPEQAKGRAVDRRADVFAFGCVLFEMLTGRQSFGKSDVTEALAAVISLPPDWTTLPANLHPRLQGTIERCLEKSVAKRYQDIGDVRLEIESVLADPVGVTPKAIAELTPTAPPSRILWLLGTVLVAALASAATWLLIPADPREVVRSTHLLGDEAFTMPGQGSQIVAISPDGTQVVYAANNQLYHRNLAEYEARPIPGTDENPASPDFSPDGEHLVYWAASEFAIKRIPVAGGTSIPIVRETSNRPRGIRWETNGMIYYTEPDGIWGVPENGGQPERLIQEDGEELTMPALLPDGEHILFMASEPGTEADTSQIVAESLDSHERTVVWPAGGVQPRYSAETGHLLFMFGNDLFAIPFDPDSLTVSGTQTAVVSGIARRGQSGDYDVSESGTLVYVPGSGVLGGASRFRNIPPSNLVFLDRDGNVDEVLDEANPRRYAHPQMSPDGTRIAVAVADADADTVNVFIYELATEQLRQLTYEGGDIPLWSPDGTEVTFRKGNSLWVIPSDFSAAEEALPGTEGVAPIAPAFAQFSRGSWSPDGSVLLFVSDEGMHAWEPGNVQEGTGDRAPVIIPNTETVSVYAPVFSPDGGWFVYVRSDASSGRQLYVDTYPVTNQRRVTNDGGELPSFASNGGQLISLVPSNPPVARAMAVSAPLLLGNPASLFSLEGRLDYDVTADGDRFIVAIPTEFLIDDDDAPVTTDPQVNIVQNWFEELKERVPIP